MAILRLNESTGAYDFETEVLRGSIQPEGAYHGVTRLEDKRSGRQVIHPLYSALNLFRLFSVNQGMGQPRFMPRTVEAGEGTVTIHWPATDAFLGEITARYTVSPPSAVDLEVTVQSTGVYPDFELFLSNYFDQDLIPHVYLDGARYGRGSGEPELTVPMVSDVYRGTVIVFPRDALAARHCVDGRWDRREFGAPTVQMCPVRRHAWPFGFVTDPERRLGVVLMSLAADCYAISTRYHAETEADRLTPYSAFDFSLFGDDVLPGYMCTVAMRLALTELDDAMSQPLALYRAFCEEAA
ncbi:MAG: hypothetical protein HYU66_24735 [Armatimonadetes bacterium]|nr:hypothetical protein [Armatimonadota bacterium]